MFSLIPWRKKPEGNGGALAERSAYPADYPAAYPIDRLWQDFDLFFDRLRNDGFGALDFPGGEHRWGFDVDDRADELVVRAEAPGFEPAEIDVQVSGNSLCIRAEHKEEHEGTEGASYQHGSFRRMLTLPQGIDADKIEARYHNGVLEVHVPKSEEAKGKRIPVKT